MHKVLVVGATLLALAGAATEANAQQRRLTGAAIGAGAGAVVAGPVGAIVGGAAGAVIGGPRITGRHRVCWRNSRGVRVCRWR